MIKTIRFILRHPLVQKQKLTAVFRYIRWQFASRLFPETFVIDWVNGSKFYAKNGATGLTGNIYVGLHELNEMGFLLHFLRAEDAFIDIGANVGSYTILASAVVGAKSFSFEPVPDTYHRLVQNVRLNEIEQLVSSYNMGVGEKPATMYFTSNLDTVNHAISSDYFGPKVEVQIISLDDVIKNENPSLIKIDVEGFELPVILGAKHILKNKMLKAVIMELNGSGDRYGYDEAKIVKIMKDNGFLCFNYSAMDRKLSEISGKNLESGNTIFVRDLDFVSDRIQSAQTVNINNRKF